MNEATSLPFSLQTYYAQRAPEYDAVYAKPERQADLRAIEQWLPHRLAQKDVLEIACGTAYWTQFIAAQARSVLGLDAVEDTLDIARQRVHAPHVRFLTADAYALPSLADSFNAAFAGFWFSHVPKQKRTAFLKNLHEALAPGATVVLLDNLYVAGSNIPISDSDENGNTFQIRTLHDGTAHRIIKNFLTEDELHGLIDGSGQDASFTTWDYFWAFEYRVAQ
jgi:ubiquinone/menaquinone biosynthesis C-methylase UbiE